MCLHDNPQAEQIPLVSLKSQITACEQCQHALQNLAIPTQVNPILQVSDQATLLIIGQAPGIKAHQSGQPFNDVSGDRLRTWLGIDRQTFYDANQVALMPMGFCFPGYKRDGSGRLSDRPPRTECAPLWHSRLLAAMPNVQLTLLIGQYAQQYYMPKLFSSGTVMSPERTQLLQMKTLTQRVASWRDFPEGYLPLVHPSPRNARWLKRNLWFETELLPELRNRVSSIIAKTCLL